MTLKEAINRLLHLKRIMGILNYEEDIEAINLILNYIEHESIPKEKIKEIIYPTPENEVPIEVQTSEMYSKLQELLGE